jgi:type I restriction enzyme, S subunit
MSNVPKLRFSEFNGVWEGKYLGDLSDIKTGNKDTQDKEENGDYPFFVRSQTIERINTYSFDGEAILTAGDGVGVGKVFHYLNEKFDFHQRVYNIHNFKENISGKYIFFYFSDKFYKRVMKLSAKNSVDSIRMDMISKMIIPLPSKPEQEKIASFLTSVDTKIEQLTKKEALLQEYKKGVMQKIFNQEIRFKDDDGSEFCDWEEKELGEIFKRVVSKNKENNKNVLTISAQQGLINQEEFFNKSVSAKDVTNYYLISKNDFAYNKSYSNGYPMGAIKKLNRYEKGVVSTLYICFRILNGNYSADFYEKYFDSGLFNREIEKIAQEGARNHGLLNVSVVDFFSSTILPCPSIEEQIKIANFLSSIDKKIENTRNELEKTKEFKKALLQQMFV